MRIDRTIIDTDNMSIEELTMIINELRNIRKRKEQARTLEMKMDELILEAKDNGFTFVDKSTCCALVGQDFTVYDERV